MIRRLFGDGSPFVVTLLVGFCRMVTCTPETLKMADRKKVPRLAGNV